MGKQGFTLMELIVCIAVLAILAGIGVPYMMGYRNRAAHGVNMVNLLTTRRQVEAVYQAFPGDFSAFGPEEEVEANEEEFLDYGTWKITAPKALGVYDGSGVTKVEEGTAMRAVLRTSQALVEALPEMELEADYAGTYWERREDSETEDTPPVESVPEEPPETEPIPETAVPGHTCRDWDGDCLCDIQGCGEAMHREKQWVENGNCEKCGIHFLHRGVADLVCDTCWMDLETGQTHVCAWAEGICRCKCGASRCDHGSTKTDLCPICGEFDYLMDPCPNCDRG